MVASSMTAVLMVTQA